MTWDTPAVLTLIEELRAHQGDFTSIEVKRGAGGTPDVADTLCAFGNMPDGGLLVIGLDEHSGFSVTGVEDPATVEQSVASQARKAVVPPVATVFSTVTVSGRHVVLAEVQGLAPSLRPCKTGGRAYLRQADGDYVMSAAEEQQLMAARDRPRYDAVPVDQTTVGDLDQSLTAEFISSVRASSRRLRDVDDLTLLRRKGVLEPHGDRLTVAGLYALGEYPQQFTPSLSVTAAVRPGPGSPDRLVDLVHLDGPIPDLLESSMEWLQRNLRTGIRVGTDGNNYDHPELPLAALREIVANALVHRDLGPNTQSRQVEVRLLPDRLIISSPGGLWGVSRKQLGTAGGKSAVNEHLYGNCTFLTTASGARVIEGEGGGIGEALRMLSDWPADPPIFVDKGVSFTAILTRPGTDLPRTAEAPEAPVPAMSGNPQSRILGVLATGRLDRTGIAEKTGLTRAQTRYALEKLVRSGQVVMNGKSGARNTTYSTRENSGDVLR